MYEQRTIEGWCALSLHSRPDFIQEVNTMTHIIHKTIKSRADGLELSVLEVVPEGNFAGIVQLVHGMSENKERYQPFMEYLAAEGF